MSTIQSKKKRWHFSIEKEFLLDRTISPMARLLYIVLESFVSPDSPRPFPGMDYLSGVLDCTRDTVLKYRKELEVKGWLHVEQRKGANQTFTNNVYSLLDGPGAMPKKAVTANLGSKSSPVRKNTTACADRALFLIPEEKMITEFSEPIRTFADFSRKRGFHIRSRFGKEISYAKGGQNGGWSRPTLLRWEEIYRNLIKHHHPEKIRRMVLRFIKYYDAEFCPEARTFEAFVNKFEKIEKFLKREKATRVARGEEDPEEAPYDDPVPEPTISSEPKPFDETEHKKLVEEIDGDWMKADREE